MNHDRILVTMNLPINQNIPIIIKLAQLILEDFGVNHRGHRVAATANRTH